MSDPKNNKPEREPQQTINKRLLVVYVMVFAVFAVLIGRLFYMQIIKGEAYTARAENNITRTVELEARRGVIYDKNGNILASSKPYMSTNVYLDEVEDRDALAQALADLFNRDDIHLAEEEARAATAVSSLSSEIEANAQKVAAAKEAEEKEKNEENKDGENSNDNDSSSKDKTDKDSDSDEDDENSDGSLKENDKVTVEEIKEMLPANVNNFMPVSVRTYTYEVGVKIAQIVAENRDLYPGVYVSEQAMRSYPNGYYLGHVLGSVGTISKSQYEEEGELFDYDYNAIVGKSGLEQYYEHYTEEGKEIGLRGKDGSRTVEVDANGNIVSTISEEAPVSGNNLVTTIDLNTQKHMEDSLRRIVSDVKVSKPDKSVGGSAVLLDIKTGGVIAMASAPSVDPNDFSRGLTQDEVDYYFSDDLKPQINRSVSSKYASGSTFKLVTATAMLREGYSPHDTVLCSPSVWLNSSDSLAQCWQKGGHGYVDLMGATAGSCNIYYQLMADKVGEKAFLQAGMDYGFGQKTNIDLPAEVSGLLPTPEWKAENKSGWEKEWHTYDTYYTAIGQGATEDTVLQLACYTATIANRGVRMKPYIVQEITDDNGTVLKSTEPTEVKDMEFTDETADLLIQAMKTVTNEGGTAVNLFDGLPDNLRPAGKTGTAQTGLAADNKNSDFHGVFIAFAPADDPEVAFACLIEYGRHGSTSAGHVCDDTLNAYFGYDVDTEIIVSSGE
ncbi:MAG: penicillin-binding transpeptidase domain-containing protein [Bacillota bacterium]|nr:penicillin-binding transpeptidase domain-containing protein [Bacillota bacterium]